MIMDNSAIEALVVDGTPAECEKSGENRHKQEPKFYWLAPELVLKSAVDKIIKVHIIYRYDYIYYLYVSEISRDQISQ